MKEKYIGSCNDQYSLQEDESKKTNATLVVTKQYWSWMNRREQHVLMVAPLLWLFLILFGVTRVLSLINLRQEITLTYQLFTIIELILISTSISTSLAVLLVISITKASNPYAVPFISWFLFSEFAMDSSRYFQLSGGVYEHLRTLCVPLSALTRVSNRTTALWVTAIVVNMYFTTRTAQVSRQRLKLRHWIIHGSVWGSTAMLAMVVLRPMLDGREEIKPHWYLVGLCSKDTRKSPTARYLLVVTLACLLVNCIMYYFLRRHIRKIYPISVKARLAKFTKILVVAFTISRLPFPLVTAMSSFGKLNIPPNANLVWVFLFHAGGMVCSVIILLDFIERRAFGFHIAAIPTIASSDIDLGDHVTFKETRQETAYLAKWKHQPICYRMVKPNLAPAEYAACTDRLKQEALMTIQLDHPNILPAYGICVDDNRFGIVTAFKDDSMVTLDSLLQSPAIHHLPLSTTLHYLLELAETLEYLHEHDPCIVHRSLSPRDIFIRPNNTICIGNFHMARAVPVRTCRSTQSTAMHPYALELFEATSYCIAPELLRPDQEYTSRVDIYSFGMIMYYMLYRPPHAFQAVNLSREVLWYNVTYKNLRPKIPESADIPSSLPLLLVQCWHAVPEERPSLSTIVTIIRAEMTKVLLFEQIYNRG